MSPLLAQFFLVAGIHLLAVMSPGPDFALVLRNALIYSRRTGVLTAVGLGLGILVHVTYATLGVALVISQSIVLFNTIKLIGAGYLIYLGVKAFLYKPSIATDQPGNESVVSRTEPTMWDAIRSGFLTNVLNPKATLFFLALFTQVISPQTGVGIKILYGAEMSLVTFTWFALVATLLTQRPVRAAFGRVQHRLEQIFGVILVGLGISIAVQSRH